MAPRNVASFSENYAKRTSEPATCVECGTAFTSVRSGHRFCTPNCWMKRFRKQSPKIKPKQERCVLCNSKFIKTEKWSTFCSSSCRAKWYKTKAVKSFNKKCSICGGNFFPQRLSQKYCSDPCKKKIYSMRAKKLKEKHSSRGQCHGCGRPKMPNNSYLCEHHWLNKIANANGITGSDRGRLVKEILERQNYICPYTGKKLIPGVNASIDHIKPKSRFPEYIDLIENIEWVDFHVNSAKREMTKEEFIEFCRTIVSRFQSK